LGSLTRWRPGLHKGQERCALVSILSILTLGFAAGSDLLDAVPVPPSMTVMVDEIGQTVEDRDAWGMTQHVLGHAEKTVWTHGGYEFFEPDQDLTIKIRTHSLSAGRDTGFRGWTEMSATLQQQFKGSVHPQIVEWDLSYSRKIQRVIADKHLGHDKWTDSFANNTWLAEEERREVVLTIYLLIKEWMRWLDTVKDKMVAQRKLHHSITYLYSDWANDFEVFLESIGIYLPRDRSADTYMTIDYHRVLCLLEFFMKDPATAQERVKAMVFDSPEHEFTL